MYEPNVGDTVWYINDMDEVTCGIVVSSEVVDKHNGYVMYSIESDDGMCNLFDEDLFKQRSDAIRKIIRSKVRELNQLQGEIAQLVSELDGENE